MERKNVEIAILRHGMPKPIPENRIPASGFIDWINSYNASKLSDTSLPTKSALSYADDCKVIVSSSLQRSIDSAKALNAEKLVLSHKQFIEAGLPSANWQLLKMPPNTWAVIFRLLWLFGYSNNSESIKEVKQRVSLAADKLIHLAKEHQKVLFVGHGVFNRLLVKELKNRGWSGPKNPGSTYWSFEIYAQ
ncbi:MAG: histidine phosphatase family protein [Sedimenticola sp.]